MQRSAADFISGVGLTEIDHNIAIFHSRFDWIPEIAFCDDVDIRIVAGKIDNSFTHAPGRANEQHPYASRCRHLSRTNSSRVLRKRA